MHACDAIWRDMVGSHVIKDGAAVLFAHGFSVHYHRVAPKKSIDVILVAPKGPGDLVRREYVRGRGVPCLFAVDRDAEAAKPASARWAMRAPSAVRRVASSKPPSRRKPKPICSASSPCCAAASPDLGKQWLRETKIEAGYKPEVAYFECMHELKLIVDLLHEGGLKKMHEFISETAKYGDLVSGPRVITSDTKQRMKDILSDIQSGAFAREWILENQAGRPRYHALLNKDLEHPIEKIGRELRARMSWLNPPTNAVAE